MKEDEKDERDIGYYEEYSNIAPGYEPRDFERNH